MRCSRCRRRGLRRARRQEHDVERLRAAIPGNPLELGAQEQFVYNADFHSVVLEASGNVLLAIAAQPVFDVLQTRLARSTLGNRFHRTINDASPRDRRRNRGGRRRRRRRRDARSRGVPAALLREGVAGDAGPRLTLPLADVRVVAVEQFGAGPWGTLQLADLGADVIKIEDPARARRRRPVRAAVPGGRGLALLRDVQPEQESVSLDLRHPRRAAVFEDLVRVADAVYSNLRGDQPAKLRLTYDAAEGRQPARSSAARCRGSA